MLRKSNPKSSFIKNPFHIFKKTNSLFSQRKNIITATNRPSCVIRPATEDEFAQHIIDKLQKRTGLKVAACGEPVESDFILQVTDSYRVQLKRKNGKEGPVFSNFVSGIVGYRSTQTINPKSPLMRACSIKNKSRQNIHIWDGTAGLGSDGFLLANEGFNVTLMERDPVIFSLLEDGVIRGLSNKKTKETLVNRIQLLNLDSVEYMNQIIEQQQKNINNSNNNTENNDSNHNSKPLPDIVYLDPMYPHRKRSTIHPMPRKQIQCLRAWIGRRYHADDDVILDAARRCAQHRVILKRPKYVDRRPETDFSYQGRDIRYDVFLPYDLKK
eukprot:gb/GECH01008520.1/.p1 GENE.gb/GECH01008520.1/~~gb/GECH01008520.1/.p1  ORF type:complete len:327 (+),score=80.42 gb/GECH01008520.1/:1-981(+)